MKIRKEIGILILILIIAAFLRFYNLMHDAPYFFDPDERNMANSIAQLRLPSNPVEIFSCLKSEFNFFNRQPFDSAWGKLSINSQQLTNCNLNPHFYAYGQFPLYLAFFSDQLFSNRLTTSFPFAIFWLRFWSAVASTLTVLMVFLITEVLINSLRFHFSLQYRTSHLPFLTSLLAAFSPGLIQAAHFGTTESLLTFFFLFSIYLSLKLFNYSSRPRDTIKYFTRVNWKKLVILTLIIGLSIGSKLTGVFFLVPPVLAIFFHYINGLKKPKKNCAFVTLFHCFVISLLVLGSIFFFIISSPYNLLDQPDFKSAVFGYEADVATGKYLAFYTWQFADSIPIIFQAQKVFPYALGWPVFILGTLGFLLINIQLIRYAILSILQKYQISNIKYQIYNRTYALILRVRRHQAPNREVSSNSSRFASLSRTISILRKSRYKLKSKNIFNILYVFLIFDISFLIYLTPNAFLYAKWTRFMTPVFPFFSIFTGYTLYLLYQFFNYNHGKIQNSKVKSQNYNAKVKIFNFKLQFWIFNFAFLILSILPGIAFMSVYARQDSRMAASVWIYDHIPDGSYILSETANVVDIPLGINDKLNTHVKKYEVISYDFYHLDENPSLFPELINHLEKSNYLLIPSRRIFYNYPKLPYRFPLVTKYYQLLFSGRLGFEKVAEISSFPNLTLNALRFTLPDENAEETFTVFDHPVIRVYKKVKSYTKEEYRASFEGQ